MFQIILMQYRRNFIHIVIPSIFLDVWKFKIRTLPACHIFPAPIFHGSELKLVRQ
jgi:hypothetical protein